MDRDARVKELEIDTGDDVSELDAKNEDDGVEMELDAKHEVL